MGREGDLIAEARRGSREAFADLLRLHQAPVRAYIGGYVRHAEVIEDLAQEAFLNAYRKLDTYRGDAPFRIWLLSIARNLALTHLRDDRRRRTRPAGDLRSALAGWVEQRIESVGANLSAFERRASALETCLSALPPASASLIREYYLHGRATDEIAQGEGKQPGAVQRALSRVRQALRRCIESRLDEQGATS